MYLIFPINNTIMAQIDYRAKIQAIGKSEEHKALIYGPKEDGNILRPLWDTNGLMFPYTPMIQVQHANIGYGQYDLPHTNYDYLAYSKTQSPSMTVTGTFGAHTRVEAEYMMAAIHFFRVVSKSNFGITDEKRGTPPPKLAFSAYGPAMFNRTPVYIRSVAFGLDQDVDYVPVNPDATTDTQRKFALENPELDTSKYIMFNDMLTKSYVPLILNVFVDLVISPNPSQLRDEFDLEAFRTGKLLDKGFY